MSEGKTKCGVCGKPPVDRDSSWRECSHVDCPHRRVAWSDRAPPPQREQTDPFGERKLKRLFDPL